MKARLLNFLPLALLCLAFGAERIQWMFHGTEILTIRRGETRLELGLRDDGVVVWREITAQPATVTTNSPAEKAQVWFQGVPLDCLTNWGTNLFVNPMPKQYIEVFNNQSGWLYSNQNTVPHTSDWLREEANGWIHTNRW